MGGLTERGRWAVAVCSYDRHSIKENPSAVLQGLTWTTAARAPRVHPPRPLRDCHKDPIGLTWTRDARAPRVHPPRPLRDCHKTAPGGTTSARRRRCCPPRRARRLGWRRDGAAQGSWSQSASGAAAAAQRGRAGRRCRLNAEEVGVEGVRGVCPALQCMGCTHT